METDPAPINDPWLDNPKKHKIGSYMRPKNWRTAKRTKNKARRQAIKRQRQAA